MNYMIFLDISDNICGSGSQIQPVWTLVNLVINVIMIGVPILLIVLGMIDLGKAVIASKEDEIKKATKAFGKRFLYAVGVFLVAWIVTFIFTNLAELGGKNNNGDNNIEGTTTWTECWKCNIRGKKKAENCN